MELTDFGFDKWLAVLLFMTPITFSPGPNILMSSAIGTNYGVSKALPFALGVPVGCSLLYWCLILGLNVILEQNEWIGMAINYAGSLFFLYLSWKIFSMKPGSRNTKIEKIPGFFQAIILQFVNLKAWIVLLGIIGTWAVGEENYFTMAVIMNLHIIFFFFTSNFSAAFLGKLLQKFLKNELQFRIYNTVMALILALMAIALMTGIF